MFASLIYPFAEGGLFATPRRFATVFAAMAVPSTAVVYFRDPSDASFHLIHCIWLVATGTYCPGCGLTRAVHDLLHGRVLEALDHNAFGIVLLFVVALVTARPLLRSLTSNVWQAPVWPRRSASWLLAGSLLWWLARNLPWAPFTLLAP